MGDKKFVIILLLLLAVYVAYELNKPQPEDWTVTYHYDSTEPFGGKAVEELMAQLFDSAISHQYKSFYELFEEDSLYKNNLVVANGIGLGKDDTEMILEQVSAGRTIFISAFGFGGALADTLGIKAEFQEFLGFVFLSLPIT